MADDFVRFPLTNLRVRRALMIDLLHDWMDQSLQATGRQIVVSEDFATEAPSFRVNLLAITAGRWTNFQTRAQSFQVPTSVAHDAHVPAPTTLAIGQTILVGRDEPMIIQDIASIEDGSATLTVGRTEKSFALDGDPDVIKVRDHKAGEPVWVLRYANPAAVFLNEVFMQWAKTKALSRGSQSAFFHAEVDVDIKNG